MCGLGFVWVQKKTRQVHYLPGLILLARLFTQYRVDVFRAQWFFAPIAPAPKRVPRVMLLAGAEGTGNFRMAFEIRKIHGRLQVVKETGTYQSTP